jgi:endonuclease III-like uncharacterized protein
MKTTRIKQIYHILHKTYGKQGWWPIINDKTLLCEYHTGAPKNDAERFEICIGAILAQGTQWYPNVVRALQQLKLGGELTKQELAAIKKAEILKVKILEKPKKITKSEKLTQNTNWQNVEKAIVNISTLKALDAERLLKLDETKLKEAIRPAGYYNQKAKKLRIFAEFYLGPKGNAPNREQLLELWGVGPETADSILLYAYKVPVFVIDAYTKRLLKSLGLADDKTEYDEMQALFHSQLPKDHKLFNEYHALIVEHAKRTAAGNALDLNKN